MTSRKKVWKPVLIKRFSNLVVIAISMGDNKVFIEGILTWSFPSKSDLREYKLQVWKKLGLRSGECLRTYWGL